MRPIQFFSLPLILAGFAAGCSNGSGTTLNAGGSGTTTATATAATGMTTTGATMTTAATTGGGAIPDPGTSNQVDIDFTDKEPNDTPQTATPLGVSSTPGVAVWVSGNMIGSSDSSDYFVFKTGGMPGPFTFDVCFNAPVTAMNASLWKVVNGMQQMPPVGTWMSGATCVTDMTNAPMLDANTVYLFGLTGTGGSGGYGA